MGRRRMLRGPETVVDHVLARCAKWGSSRSSPSGDGITHPDRRRRAGTRVILRGTRRFGVQAVGYAKFHGGGVLHARAARARSPANGLYDAKLDSPLVAIVGRPSSRDGRSYQQSRPSGAVQDCPASTCDGQRALSLLWLSSGDPDGAVERAPRPSSPRATQTRRTVPDARVQACPADRPVPPPPARTRESPARPRC